MEHYLLRTTAASNNYGKTPFVLPLTRSKIVRFKEHLVVITALNNSGSFGMYFVKF